ncbi:DUF551 domain-containing protein [Escherichia coli]|nr:DUF551 domain-containing protein [Escherichia coli]EFB2469432.1 DUF551 domain-containing protein [Escherichia coli]EHR8237981.1 DUF551 domain-containing protein [Escherichia coli]
MTTITREQAQKIIEAADEVISALAGTNEDVHPGSDNMLRLWDDLNDRHAPPEVVRELARIVLASLEAEPVSQTYKLNELSGNSPVIPDGWISCSERMPSEEDVLVYCSDTKEQMVGFHKGKGLFQFFYMNGVEGVCEPSHWMPLPEPPQEVNRG